MEVLSTYSNYQQFKQALDAEMTRTAEGFVRIGYMLAYAADTNIVNEGGYATVNDFAKAEYGIDATQVSRFVNIHRRFGVHGEPRLQEQYMNHGVAKLGVMLTLPDYVNEEISENYSRSEITAIKREIEAEQEISDIEVAIEKRDIETAMEKGEIKEIAHIFPEGLQQAVCQLIHDKPKLYVRMYSCIELNDLKEIMAPMGENSFIVRIKGIGRVAVFLRADGDISVTNLRTGDKEYYEWQQLFDALTEYYGTGVDAKDSWSRVFMEPFPEEEKEEIEKELEKPAKPDKHNAQQAKPKKEKKVNVVTPKPKKEKPKLVEEPEKEAEEQLPGQMTVTDFPGYLPESMKEDKSEVLTGEVVDAEGVIKDTENVIKDVEGVIKDTENVIKDTENVIKDTENVIKDTENVIKDVEDAEKPQNENVQRSQDDMKIEYIAPVQDVGTEHVANGLKNVLKASVETLVVMVEKEDWPMVISKATDIVHRAKKIMELEEKN